MVFLYQNIIFSHIAFQTYGGFLFLLGVEYYLVFATFRVAQEFCVLSFWVCGVAEELLGFLDAGEFFVEGDLVTRLTEGEVDATGTFTINGLVQVNPRTQISFFRSMYKSTTY